MSNEFARSLLIEQRKRMVGTLMRYLEDHVYEALSTEQQKELRKRVLTSTAQYHDVCLDMLKATINDGSVINDEAVRMLAGIHRKVMDG